MNLSVDELKSIFQNPKLYRHSVEQPIRTVETHISLIFLTGLFAYKVKKSLILDFLDFRTLASRHQFCSEELRLNRRTAPELYLDLMALTRRPEGFTLIPEDNARNPLEFVIRMKQFSSGSLFSEMIRKNRLQPRHARTLGNVVARFHENCQRCDTNTKFGTMDEIRSDILANIEEMDQHCRRLGDNSFYERLRTLSEDFISEKTPLILNRRDQHMIRECHGDLHLGNIALYEDKPVPFDCIEFNERFRWIDVAADYAFPYMDLLAHNASHYASLFLHEYLEVSGDHCGVALLPLYISRQAAVRAKVLSLVAETEGHDDIRQAKMSQAHSYNSLALNSIELPRGIILVVCGLSGSGKSTLAQLLASAIHGIQLRSDVIRKHLLGITRDERANSEGYSQDMTDAVYSKLAKDAVLLAGSGWTVLVDATFCSQRLREVFSHYCSRHNFNPIFLHCEAPYRVLVERIEQRQGDVSDADSKVLAQQTFDPFNKLTDNVLTLDSTQSTSSLVEEVLQRLQLSKRFNVQ